MRQALHRGGLLRQPHSMSHITDGANTYLVGEKYLWPEGYETGTEGGDNETALMGDNADIGRWTAECESWLTSVQYYPPYPDSPGWDSDSNFGTHTWPASIWRSATARSARSIMRSTRRPIAALATAKTVCQSMRGTFSGERESRRRELRMANRKRRTGV